MTNERSRQTAFKYPAKGGVVWGGEGAGGEDRGGGVGGGCGGREGEGWRMVTPGEEPRENHGRTTGDRARVLDTRDPFPRQHQKDAL